MGKSLASSFLCIVFSAATLGHAVAAETRIRTLSLARLPEATTIEIRLPVEEGSDDLRLSVILANHFSDLLTELGYTAVDADGELIFRFAAEEPTFAQGQGRFRHAGLVIDKVPVSGRDAWSHPAALASLAALTKSDRDIYRLRVSVARARRPPLWTGYIQRTVAGEERQATYLSMADALLAFWGQTYSSSD